MLTDLELATTKQFIKTLSLKQVSCTRADGTVDVVLADPPAPPPPPPPPPPPGPVLQVVNQATVAWYKQVDNSADITINNVVLTNGGGLHFRSTGRAIVKNFFSRGVPSGKAMYFLMIATAGCKELIWDNRECSKDLADGWISHGNETAVRLMGRFKKATLYGVKLVGRMHDTIDKGAGAFNPDDWVHTKLLAPPKYTSNGIVHPALLHDSLSTGGKAEWWKMAGQFRDGDDLSIFESSFVGLWAVGAQKSPDTKQFIHKMLVQGCGLTDEPWLEDKSSYGRVERKDCYVLDLAGRPVLKGGQLVKWQNKVWQGDA